MNVESCEGEKRGKGTGENGKVKEGEKGESSKLVFIQKTQREEQNDTTGGRVR